MPRYNIAPTQLVLTVIEGAPGERVIEPMRWGLIPRWARDTTIGNRTFNARCETVHELPAFREAFKRRRCLIPATGFYEWTQLARNQKVPLLITLSDGALMALAGLWEEWYSREGEVIRSTTIVTTTPNAFMEPIHNRMPVILTPDSEGRWLKRPTDAVELRSLLVPYEGELISRPVSPLLNASGVEGAHLHRPNTGAG